MENAETLDKKKINVKKTHVKKILSVLEKIYPEPKAFLNFSTPFELLVAAILSSQSTDKEVNKVTANLFQKYRTPQDFAQLKAEELAKEIKSCGLYRNKSKNIIEASKTVLEKYAGEVPHTREELMTLPGVGRKTANVILSNAFSIPALGVDTHVFRVAHRLGLAQGKTPEAVEKELTAIIPPQQWLKAHHWFILHGRNWCRARNPLCSTCPLIELCPYPEKNADGKSKENN